MLYSIEGKLAQKGRQYAIIEVSGLGFQVYMGEESLRRLPEPGSPVKCFSSLYSRDDRMEIYGFLDEPSMRLFELLCGVSGVGPKSALSILDIDSVQNITAAILERKADVLTRASGVGKKTAERITIDLQNKLELSHSAEIVKQMSVRQELEEVLSSLGYQKYEVQGVLNDMKTPSEGKSLEEHLREALKLLGEKRNAGK